MDEVGSYANPIRSACVIIHRNGLFSAIHHSKRDQNELAGGKVDPGETVEEGAAREAWEELGVRVFNLRPLFTTPILGKDTRYYRCTVFQADIAPEDDIKSSKEGWAFWATLDELATGTMKRMNTIACLMVECGMIAGKGE